MRYWKNVNKILSYGNFWIQQIFLSINGIPTQSIGQSRQDKYIINTEGISNKVPRPSVTTHQFSIAIPAVSQMMLISKQVLSKISQMLSSLRLIGPVVVTAKIIMQKIWTAKINLDDNLMNLCLMYEKNSRKIYRLFYV